MAPYLRYALAETAQSASLPPTGGQLTISEAANLFRAIHATYENKE